MIYNILFVYFIVLCLYLGVPYLIRILLKKKFLSDMGKDDQVCLTFDDGPNPESTPDILELLEDLGVKATFFLIGENVKKYPDLYHKIIKQGHEIGDHGYRHINACACLPFCAVIDLIRGSSIIKKNGNIKEVFWLRPPYGKLNLLTLCYVLLCRRKLAFWNIDPRDYLAQPPEQISALVLKKITRGSVILLHERSFYTNENMEGNISAIKVIVQEIERRGYRFAMLSDAVPTRN